MNAKRIMLQSLLIFHMLNLFSQTITYTYDPIGNGNRLGRTLTAAKLVSNIVEFPIVDQKSLSTLENIYSSDSSVNTDVADESASEKVFTNENDIATLVYPNPTKGLIKIEVSNMPLSSKSEMRLYDLSGNEKLVKRAFENNSEIDLSQLRDGIYILRIKINESIFDWKVMKSHN